MVAGISKRQQQRNERALQDLIRSVPGNDRCADCSAMNPGWASWNLGVFLCMRCAALHRKMGTHISKVKSLSMDSWSAEQVDEMKSHGNTIVNKLYNPRNVQPPVPTDIDEADACMERFIRQKYQTRTLEDGRPKPPSRQDPSYTRSPGSPEASPPPLPPKPTRPFGFGLRSASSATNLSRHSAGSRGPDSPVSESQRSSFESKLMRLRELGFTNERRNITALKGLDGNLDKTIETLVRVGEGKQTPQARTPAATSPGASTNPFDQLDAKQPAHRSQPNGQSYNPFDMPARQTQLQPQPASTQSLEQSFQHLQVAQPLFPHSTGGYPNRQVSFPQPTYTQPPVPSFPAAQAGLVPSSQPLEGGMNPFSQTGAQPQASFDTQPQNPYSNQQTNPFFSQLSTQAPQPSLQNQTAAVTTAPGAAFPQPLRHANTMPPIPTSPFGQTSPFQQPQQPQLGLQTVQPAQNSSNPFQSVTAPNTPLSGGYPGQSPFGYPPSAQALAPQRSGVVDKNSILALYNFSAPPPPIPEQQQAQPPTAPGGVPAGAQDAQTQSTINAQAAGSRNPFGLPSASSTQQAPAQPATYGVPLNSAGSVANTAFMRNHMSQQSVDINGLQNGRHSPDAFASLSARFGR
ncbi:putative GTPase activating protein for Arf [Aspergillus lucknowensis]|uniref:Arf-GAP domain-containing protein n=1 Tax=Aspergillus lucknowensis TaxID=176173 RepID=A0ABR4M2T8_9EURO